MNHSIQERICMTTRILALSTPNQKGKMVNKAYKWVRKMDRKNNANLYGLMAGGILIYSIMDKLPGAAAALGGGLLGVLWGTSNGLSRKYKDVYDTRKQLAPMYNEIVERAKSIKKAKKLNTQV